MLGHGEVKANLVRDGSLRLVENLAIFMRKTKIIFTIRNRDTPIRENFRTLCNSYAKSAEQAVEKFLNSAVSKVVAAGAVGKKNCTDLALLV